MNIERKIISRILKRVNETNIQTVKKEIEINHDWTKKVSPEQQKLVFRITKRYKKALRKLSEN